MTSDEERGADAVRTLMRRIDRPPSRVDIDLAVRTGRRGERRRQVLAAAAGGRGRCVRSGGRGRWGRPQPGPRWAGVELDRGARPGLVHGHRVRQGARQLDTREGAALRTVAAVACAAVIPALVFTASIDRGTTLLPVGWLLGGAELTLSISINMSHLGTLDANRTKVTALWLLLPLTTGATAAAGWLFGQKTADRPR